MNLLARAQGAASQWVMPAGFSCVQLRTRPGQWPSLSTTTWNQSGLGRWTAETASWQAAQTSTTTVPPCPAQSPTSRPSTHTDTTSKTNILNREKFFFCRKEVQCFTYTLAWARWGMSSRESCLLIQITDNYTVSFTSNTLKVHDRRQIKNRHHKNWRQPRKSKQHKTQQNKTSMVYRFLRPQPTGELVGN